MLTAFYQQMGESDCETIGSGFLAQPVNAVSSLVFSGIGLFVILWAMRVTGNERVVRIVFGALMVLTGAGSVLFHGLQGPAARFGHDATFLMAIWFLAITNVAGVYRWSQALGWGVFVVGALVLAGVLTVASGATNVLMVAAVALLVASDTWLRRRGRASSSWYTVSLAAIVAGTAMFLLGRTGAPLCDPDSLLQGHSLWHVFAAVALGAYFVATSRWRETESEGTGS